MEKKKRAPKAPPPPPPEPPPAPGTQTKTVCVAMDALQRERLAVLAKREPREWGHSQWVRQAMAAHGQLERVVEALPGLDAYAVSQHLTVPPKRRRADDVEWKLDALCQLARERLEELQSSAKPPGGQ